MISFLFFILICFWAIHILERAFYCIYFWQLKEYRFDRIKGDPIRSLRIFFPRIAFLMGVILLFLLLPPDSNNPGIWNNFVISVFCILGIYSGIKLFMGRWKFPKFTKKALVLIFLSLATLGIFAFVFAGQFAVFIVVAEIAIPFGTFLIVQILQMPTCFWKEANYRNAEAKIGKLKKLTVVAISGSYGKSSTKEFLYTILSKKFKVLKTSGNINTEIGVAQTILKNLDESHNVFIVEMGAYRKGEIKLMCQMVKPKIGIVTGVNEQHLALFGSMENLLSAEGGGELSDALKDGGTLVVNGDNKYCLELLKKNNVPSSQEKIYLINKGPVNADIWSEDLVVHKNSISFIARDKQGEMAHFDVKVLGGQNTQNLLGAILVAKQLGMNFGEISEACKNIKQEQTGMILKQGKHGIDIVDSSYSANPDGVLADLDYLSIFPKKKVIVMPCLIELGKKSSEIHKKIGKKIAEVCNLAIITTKDRFKELKKGAMEGGMNESDILLCDKPQDIYSMVTLFCKQGDAVLLEGRVPKELINLLIK
ncbi:MAG: UDP-N-acetylmuramoyl-tripeptide--D-alanyl-D-alanine ligase [Candidatus Staskawiczbacteria bacterium]|nr:UDP-N-acetylmuramoyl-tripeptide--D-alanyl-D-alanine ligase [Candidatus Staskawiczbacteria bacterium]